MEAQQYRTHGGQHPQNVNDSPAVRSGLAEPTVMGTPVLAEDLYATHSDIVDPPVRSFAQWEEEEKHGSPPPLSTDYETHRTHPHHGTYGQGLNTEQWGNPTGLQDVGMHGEQPFAGIYGGDVTYPTPVDPHGYGDQDVDREQPRASIRNSTGMMEENPTISPADRRSELTDTYTTNTGTINDHEVGITDVLRSFDKMNVYDEPDTKTKVSDQNEPKAGSHDQLKLEPSENPIVADASNRSSSYTQRISSAKTAIADKAAAVKETVVSKLSSGEGRSKKSSFPTELSHKVADTLSSTLGPVYEKVASDGSPAVEGKGYRVKEYLVEALKPAEDDKVLSEVITNALHGGKGKETSTTTYGVAVIRDEGERRLQDSGN